MNNEASAEFLQVLMGMTAITVVSGVMLIFMVWFSFSFLVYLKKSSIRRKLKRYDISNYEVVCNQKGLPSTLISKKDNTLIIL